ncbi:MAG: DNA internalization-related competence protein ComEC/Rec2, partial [Oscillibacter sp.]|nr:DNA internalization-related competence protein ComEC/Rec2 [Oscillibacter sp.]
AEIVVYPPLGEKTDNERGISVRVSSGEDSVFITGDMSQETERLLLRTYALEESDVLVVGHHGARNSTSQALLDALEPSVACISVGSNSYGHPHTETLERLAQQGCEIYRTDLQGDIHLSLNP